MRLPQFTLAGILRETFWLAVCVAGWQLPEHLNMPGFGGTLVVLSLRYIPILVAVGALFGHTLPGLMIGGILLISWLAFAAFVLLNDLAGPL